MDRNNLTRAQWFEEVILLIDLLHDEIREVAGYIDEVSSIAEPEIITAQMSIHGVSFYFLGCEIACFSESERLNPDRIAYRLRRAITRYARAVSDLDRFSEYRKPHNPNVVMVDEFGLEIDFDLEFIL